MTIVYVGTTIAVTVSDKTDRWDEPSKYTLTELEAFDAMRKFLEGYWHRGRCASDDLAVLLGNINRNVREKLGLAIRLNGAIGWRQLRP